MAGGLLNIVAYGNQNVILNGNPTKTFFKSTYKKYNACDRRLKCLCKDLTPELEHGLSRSKRKFKNSKYKLFWISKADYQNCQRHPKSQKKA